MRLSFFGRKPAPECSLALCEVLEEEFRQITGEEPDPPPPLDVVPEQILEPHALRARLIDGTDRAAAGLAAAELRELVQDLRSSRDAGDATLRAKLAAGLNALLDRDDLFGAGVTARFDGVRFRSHTRERIAVGPVRERNRLIVEDVFPEIERRADARLKRIYARIHARKPSALCLSGGGIRSASFALGVTQGLARLGLLQRFQYLSTVSGGGYLGSWLNAWMHRATRNEVIRELTVHSGRPLSSEPTAIRHLRAYSSYLSPQLGLLSADTWTLAATYLRNLLLNWLVLVPLLASALVVPQLLTAIVRLPRGRGPTPFVFTDAAFVFFFVLSVAAAVAAARYFHANLPIREATAPDQVLDARRGLPAFLEWCLVPLIVGATGLAVIWAWVASGKVDLVTPVVLVDTLAAAADSLVRPVLLADAIRYDPGAWGLILNLDAPRQVASAWIWVGTGTLVHLAGWALARKNLRWSQLPVVLVTGALGGLAVGLVAHGLVPSAARASVQRLVEYAWFVALAVPAFLGAALLVGHLYVGVTSRTQPDAAFEWSARAGAWLLIVGAVWLVACGVVIMAPIGIAWAFNQVTTTGFTGVVQAVVSVVGVAAGFVTLRRGFSGPATPASAGAAPPRRGLTQALAMPVFIGLLLVLLSRLIGWLMERSSRLGAMFVDASCGSEAKNPFDHALREIMCGSVPSALLVLVALAGFGLLMSLVIDTNRFSLHGMYRARLIRAFLGASRPARERDPNRFTGFDEHDDLPLADLWHPGRQAPLHVVNVALNLVGGDELAWQQRKATSFTLSPLHSGAFHLGYRPTREYGGGVTLGTAVTISGAAASPEMGYHTSPLLAFLLTLFNVRLGWWLGNPGWAGRLSFRRAAPASSVLPILDEALGRTDDRNPNVYLSDGGHFENLALYEMVLRRCRWIVVSDGGCDPGATFEDLGNAIRRIRVDFGIPIEIAEVPIYSRGAGETARTGGTYCAVGRIRYSRVDAGAPDGTLVYIKPAFYGREPPDVFNYAHSSPTFPHETTADQFFTEAQFESYRQLGAFVVEHITASATAPGAPAELTPDGFVERIEAHLRETRGR